MPPTDIDPSSHGVTEDLRQDAPAQVPQILGPNALGVEAPCQLTVDGRDQPVQATQHARALRLRVAFLDLVRGQQADAALGQFLHQGWRPTVAVANADAVGRRLQLPCDLRAEGSLPGNALTGSRSQIRSSLLVVVGNAENSVGGIGNLSCHVASNVGPPVIVDQQSP